MVQSVLPRCFCGVTGIRETPLWMGREMEKMIPDSALIILEGGTHFAYLEQVDRFCTIVSEFLKEE